MFGQVKSNNSFNRFKLRSLAKVKVEFGLAVIGHNLRKMVARDRLKEQQQLAAMKKTITRSINSLVDSCWDTLLVVEEKLLNLLQVNYTFLLAA